MDRTGGSCRDLARNHPQQCSQQIFKKSSLQEKQSSSTHRAGVIKTVSTVRRKCDVPLMPRADCIFMRCTTINTVRFLIASFPIHLKRSLHGTSPALLCPLCPHHIPSWLPNSGHQQIPSKAFHLPGPEFFCSEIFFHSTNSY